MLENETDQSHDLFSAWRYLKNISQYFLTWRLGGGDGNDEGKTAREQTTRGSDKHSRSVHVFSFFLFFLLEEIAF